MTEPSRTPSQPPVLSIRALLIASAAVLLLFVVLTVVALARLVPHARALREGGESLATVSLAIQSRDSALGATADELTAAAETVRRSGRLPPATSDALRTRLRVLFDSTFSAQGKVFGSIPDSARVALARATLAETDATLGLLDAEIRLTFGDVAGALAAVANARVRQAETRRHLDALTAAIVADLAEHEIGYARASARAVRVTIWWAVVGFGLVAALSLLAYVRLYEPLAALERGLRELGSGNFRHRLTVRRNDELGRLQTYLNSVAETLGERASVEARHAHNLSVRLGRVLDEGSNEIYIFDAETWRFLVTSRAARRNLGYTDVRLAGMTPLDLLPEYSRDRFAAVLETVRGGVQPRVFLTTTQRRADGSTYPVEMVLQFSDTETPAVYHAVVQDITERMRIEAERDLVFQHSADLMAIGNITTRRWMRVNPAMVAVLGQSESDLVARPFLDFVHPEDQPLARRQLDQLAEGVPVRGTAVRVLGGDGEYRWVSWNIEPPREGMIYAIGRDITDRRRAETRQAELQAAVARSAREWRMTFDALDDPVVIVSQSGQIVRLNEAARRLSGQSHGDVLGRGLDVLEPPALWRRAAELAEQVRRDGRPASSQLRSGRDGRTWDLQIHSVSGAGAGAMAAIIIAHDVTPVVLLQDSARRNEAMAAMGALVAGVAHEVRNPLFSMTATLDAFEARLSAEQASQRHIRVLRSQLDRLQQLMRELLEYGKPPQLSLGPVGFDQVARQAAEESALIAREHGVAIEIDVPPALPLVRADRARLAQVYVNLLTNAIHHSPEGARVAIRARDVRENGASWLETEVEDSGKGFRPEDLPRIFEPFFSRRPGGTGLGLALVQRIVEQHGGAVAAANRADGGAVVSVRLPLPPD